MEVHINVLSLRKHVMLVYVEACIHTCMVIINIVHKHIFVLWLQMLKTERPTLGRMHLQNMVNNCHLVDTACCYWSPHCLYIGSLLRD